MQHLNIDGAQGEGGGQILRTSLSLSMITGKPFRLSNIRAARKKPGLMRQHLVCVQAAQRICHARVEGAYLGSQTLTFYPQQVQSGHYEFNIGSAGSTLLVFQTLLPALMLQPHSSKIHISGGTHNPLAPSANFVESCFLPALHKMGISVQFKMEKAGFFPIGGGYIHATIEPWAKKTALTLTQKQSSPQIKIFGSVLNLPLDILDREFAVLKKCLNTKQAIEVKLNGISEGNHLFVNVYCNEHTQQFCALGEKRKPGEQIAKSLGEQVLNYLDCPAMVDEYLTDQLLLPMALGQGGMFTAQTISQHTKTQADIIQKFIDCDIQFQPQSENSILVSVNTHYGKNQ